MKLSWIFWKAKYWEGKDGKDLGNNIGRYHGQDKSGMWELPSNEANSGNQKLVVASK